MDIVESIKDILRPAYRNFLSYRHRGSRYQCNICGRSHDNLRPVYGCHHNGEIFVVDDHVGTCWYCNSYPRMRQLWYWLCNDYNLCEREGIKILHVAPETMIADILRSNGRMDYVAIDLKCPGYRYPKYVKEGNVCNLEYANNEFDLVLCNHVLEHIKNDAVAMKEIFRVLKPGGMAVLMVPIDLEKAETYEEHEDEELTAQEREQLFGQYDHVRIYGQDYFQRLTQAGFEVHRITYAENIVDKYGLSAGEELVVAVKPISDHG